MCRCLQIKLPWSLECGLFDIIIPPLALCAIASNWLLAITAHRAVSLRSALPERKKTHNILLRSGFIAQNFYPLLGELKGGI